MTYQPAASRNAILPLRVTPQISALQAFERTASLRSFSRAALELAVTPSAISHQIRGLEQYFGTQLFVRGRKSVALTKQGELFATQVRAGLQQLDWASRNLLQEGRSNRHRLRVRTSPDLAHLFLFDAFREFERGHPSLTVSLDVSASSGLDDADGPLVIIQIGKADLHAMRLHPLMDMPMVPVASGKLEPGDLADPANLLRHRLIHIRSHPTAWRDHLGTAETAPLDDGAIWVENITAALHAARAGLGVALAPRDLIARETQNGLRIGHAATGAGRQTLYLACRPEQKEDRRVAGFTAWLTDYLRRMPTG